MTAIQEPRLRNALAGIVGEAHVLSTPEEREEYSLDAYALWRALPESTAALPDVVVRPADAAEVQAIVHLAQREGAPIVPYGGGTGVMGAAIATKRGIVMDLRRLDRVRYVSADGMMAQVEAGAILGDVDRALDEQGLMLGHDPWSQPIATIGGAISTNGVGYLAAAYGTMGEQVLSLEAVLPNGELHTGRDVSIAAGPRLDGLMIGAEGTLGIITAATIRVFPKPERRWVHAIDFPSFDAGFGAILAMGREGLRVSMIDYAEEPFERGPQGRLYLAFEGHRAVAAAQREGGLAVCRERGGQDAGGGDAQRFWEERHRSAERFAERTALGRRFARMRHPGTSFDYLHVSLPVERVLEYKARCEETLRGEGLQAREFAIWGRPDLLSVAYSGPERQDGGMMPASALLLRLAREMGGSMEYCHGVGLKLLPFLEGDMGEALAALRSVKAALDPRGIMNPGKLGL